MLKIRDVIVGAPKIVNTCPVVNLIISNKKYCTSPSKSLKNDDRFLHKSRVPTMHFQPSLPRLPIPSLNKTCERYLNAQKPLLAADQFSITEKIVNEFEAGIGKELDTILREEDKKNKHTSYITAPWFDMYLRDRTPIVLNYNPFLSFIDDIRPGYNDQVIRASNFLVSAIRFRETLRSGLLEPEVYHMNAEKSDTDTFRTVVRLLPSSISWYGAYLFKAFPLDMSQYSSLFNSTRIPELGKDRLVRYEQAKHILVMRGGHFYIFDVLDKDGNILDPHEIYACMDYIAKDTCPPPSHPLGYLTSENRDTWAAIRGLLIANNEEQLKFIDSALFNLVLDDAHSHDDPKKLTKLFLHGNGSNRWFDKSFSLIVAQDGKSAINFEHSWGDGVAVMRFFNEVYKDSTSKARIHPGDKPSNRIDPTRHVQRLEFKLDNAVQSAVDAARKKFDQTTSLLDVDIFKYEGFSKGFCKEQKVSPDAIMQLGFQLAYYKQNGTTCATYESCSTAAFKHGRTETIRPCTIKTKTFCEAITRRAAEGKNSQLRSLIGECSALHGQLTKDAAMGQGFDRHLFALKLKSQENSLPLPSLFKDPAYSSINYNILSTSTLSSPAVLLGGFAPVVPDGYGIGYVIQDNLLGAVVTTYRPQRNGSDFVACLQSAFHDIEQVLRRH